MFHLAVVNYFPLPNDDIKRSLNSRPISSPLRIMAKACSPLPAKKQAKNRVPEINGMEGDYTRAAIIYAIGFVTLVSNLLQIP